MRASSCYLGPVGTASFLLPIILMAYCRIVRCPQSLNLWQKFVYMTLFIATTLLLVLTYSRAAWVFMVLLLVLLFISKPNKTGFTLISLTVIVIWLLLPDPAAMVARSAETINPVKEGSFQGHVTMSQAAWEMFRQAPLLGNGAGSFKETLVETYQNFPRKMDAHNFLLQSLAETGLVGFSCLIWLFWRYFKTLFRGLRMAESNFDRTSILGLLFAGLGTMLMNLTMNGFMVEFFWVILGLGFASAKVVFSSKK